MTPRRYTLLLFAIAAVLFLALMAWAFARERWPIRVVDGDTLKVTVRLAKIDTPEIKRAKCDAERRRGLRAAVRLRQLIAGARKLELAPSGRWDRYGRLLASVRADGRDVEEVLVAEGLARPYAGGRRQGWCS